MAAFPHLLLLDVFQRGETACELFGATAGGCTDWLTTDVPGIGTGQLHSSRARGSCDLRPFWCLLRFSRQAVPLIFISLQRKLNWVATCQRMFRKSPDLWLLRQLRHRRDRFTRRKHQLLGFGRRATSGSEADAAVDRGSAPWPWRPRRSLDDPCCPLCRDTKATARPPLPPWASQLHLRRLWAG